MGDWSGQSPGTQVRPGRRGEESDPRPRGRATPRSTVLGFWPGCRPRLPARKGWRPGMPSRWGWSLPPPPGAVAASIKRHCRNQSVVDHRGAARARSAGPRNRPFRPGPGARMERVSAIRARAQVWDRAGNRKGCPRSVGRQLIHLEGESCWHCSVDVIEQRLLGKDGRCSGLFGEGEVVAINLVE